MQRHVTGNVAYYTFDSLNHTGSVVHAISTRHGGVSPVPFDTLNLSHTVGDDLGNVRENMRRLHDALGLDGAATVSARQALADRVATVGARHRGTLAANTDALLTNIPGVPLLLRYADCVPVFLYDAVHAAIGVVHAGWRGTIGKVVMKAAQGMFDTFDTRPCDLLACIAPSIGPCCYRIGDDVIAQIRAALHDADDLLIPQADGVHFDLWQANARQLHVLGIHRIEIAGLCTAHCTDEFYSWRAENGQTGRFGAIIAIK